MKNLKALHEYEDEVVLTSLRKLLTQIIACEKMLDECGEDFSAMNCDNCPLDELEIMLPFWQQGNREGFTDPEGLVQGSLIFPINPCKLLTRIQDIVGYETVPSEVMSKIIKCEEISEKNPELEYDCIHCMERNYQLELSTMGSDDIDVLNEGIITLPIMPCQLIKALAVKIYNKDE